MCANSGSHIQCVQHCNSYTNVYIIWLTSDISHASTPLQQLSKWWCSSSITAIRSNCIVYSDYSPLQSTYFMIEEVIIHWCGLYYSLSSYSIIGFAQCSIFPPTNEDSSIACWVCLFICIFICLFGYLCICKFIDVFIWICILFSLFVVLFIH